MEENKPAQTVPENINPTRPISEVSNSTVSPDNTFEKPKPKFSISAIIGIIIFLLLAGGGAAASFTIFKPQIMKLVSKPTPTPTLTVVQSPTLTPYPTANWKTYNSIHPDFPISFEYPPKFSHFTDSTNSPEAQNMLILDFSDTGDYYNGDELFVGVYTNADYLYNSQLERLKNLNKNELYIYSEITKTLVNKMSAIAYFGKSNTNPSIELPPGRKKGDIYETLIYNGTTLYSITYRFQDVSNKNKEKEIFQKILSTFKFTENSADNQLLLERQDADTRDALVEFSNANIRYYTTHAGFPWSVAGPCQSSATTNPQGITLGEIVPCINLLINEGELKGSFLSASEQSIAKIFVTSQDTNLNICYKPSSIKEQVKPETIYDVYGKVDKSCSTTGNKCFWCAQ